MGAAQKRRAQHLLSAFYLDEMFDEMPFAIFSGLLYSYHR